MFGSRICRGICVGKRKYRRRENHTAFVIVEKENYLLPATSISLIATPMLGSINKVVTPLISRDAESGRIPRFARSTPTPACWRIWGV